ncbi:MAG: ATP synthase F1 subunit gamma [Elusimicrobia bacterium]|nr:ATP synthase F1 subunit gamma [Elusimicrobiota bacterium]MBU2615449.1 ATP synthase F1 subunit gamma [Elusimicrobiota bacterium]
MPSISALRRKIKGFKSTQQITKAMKMIAGARLARAQKNIINARPYAVKMQELLSDLAVRTSEFEVAAHPLLKKQVSKKAGLLVITGDKGLCGGFNNNVIRKAMEFINQQPGTEIKMFVAGRKAQEYFRRLNITASGEYSNIFSKLGFVHAELIGQDLINIYIKENLSKIVMIYNEFKSAISQQVVQVDLLPVEKPVESKKSKVDFLYEPQKDKILESLLPRYVKSQVFRSLLESYAAELSARMNAMDNATKSATELIEDLTLHMNKIRQANITMEIADIVGAVEALK